MELKDFKALRYGNVIEDGSGGLFMIKQVVRDKEGNAKFVGLAECLDAKDAERYEVVSRAYISGPTIHEVE